VAEIVRTIASECGQYRALVVRYDGGPFRVEVERWREEWVPDHGKVGEGWSRITEGATYADSLERATELAEEELRLAVSLRR
jgi:hypothetical protein